MLSPAPAFKTGSVIGTQAKASFRVRSCKAGGRRRAWQGRQPQRARTASLLSPTSPILQIAFAAMRYHRITSPVRRTEAISI